MSNVRIFIDTNFFCGVSKEDVEWKEILTMSQKGEIEILTHKIVVNELIARKKEEYSKSLGYIQKFKSTLSNAFKYLDIDLQEVLINKFTDENQIKQDIEDGIKEFFDKNKIKILDYSYQEVNDVFDKYFNQIRPFTEHSHKKHLPDAFIIEGFISDKKNDDYYFVKDDHFRDSLKIKHGVSKKNIYDAKSFKDIPILGNAKPDNNKKSGSNYILSSNEEEAKIKNVILALSIISPTRNQILNFLENIDYDREKADLIISRIILDKKIKEVDGHIIAIDKELCNNSFNNSQDIIIDYL